MSRLFAVAAIFVAVASAAAIPGSAVFVAVASAKTKMYHGTFLYHGTIIAHPAAPVNVYMRRSRPEYKTEPV